jgi:AmmeMemoRadiSam system protein B
MFYPDNPAELIAAVNQYLQSAPEVKETPKAIIVPHAGYIYSGPVAASAYACLIPLKKQITRVVLLGPSHRVPLLGMATSSADRFLTPLGAVEIDKEAVNAIQKYPQVHTMNEAHTLEHSLEVQLPFLQLTLDDFKLVPVVVGDASPDEVANVLNALWGGPETLIVISSDLSHYHDYSTAQKMDSRTSAAIESLRPEDIHYDDACGRNPVNGLLEVARQRHIHARTVDLRNSGDTAGSRDQVVGYGAYLFYQ